MPDFGENLLFLISQPRSGSTLLQRILAGHSNIHTHAEPWVMLHPLFALRDNGISTDYDHEVATIARQDFVNSLPNGEKDYLNAIRAYGNSLYEAVLQGSGKKYFLDKTPRYYFIIEELQQVYPQAKFIILLRNPLAVLASILDVWVPYGWWWEPDIIVKYIHDLLTAPRLMLNAINQNYSNTSVVRFENLVTEPEDVIRKLCTELGIQFESEMMNYSQHKKPNGKLGDANTVDKQDKVVSGMTDKWLKQLMDPRRQHFAKAYMSLLGPNIVNELGYDFNNLMLQMSYLQSDSPLLNEKKLGEVDAVIALFAEHKLQNTQNLTDNKTVAA